MEIATLDFNDHPGFPRILRFCGLRFDFIVLRLAIVSCGTEVPTDVFDAALFGLMFPMFIFGRTVSSRIQ